MIMSANRVTIDLDALRHNFREIRRIIGPQVGIIAVVKSDAYGHGMIPVTRALAPEGPAFFAVFELDEALKLKRDGCAVPILILMGARREEISAVVDQGFSVCLFLEQTARDLSEAAQSKGVVAPVHVKVDTGMNRLGVPWTDLPRFLDRISTMKGIRIAGLCSHLAAADDPDNDFTDQQRERFLSAVSRVSSIQIRREMLHFGNSAAVLSGIGGEVGLVRPGLALYGSSPGPRLGGNVRLKRAMSFKSTIIQVRIVPPGTPISYGGTYKTQGAATIATIPVGYDDGFSRSLSNKGEVLIHGTRVPVVGRVCMNLTMVDVSGLQGVRVGDEVVLMGVQGSEEITAEAIAAQAGTISYEIYCSLGKSNHRTYVPAAAAPPAT